jgi:hypothetical protein
MYETFPQQATLPNGRRADHFQPPSIRIVEDLRLHSCGCGAFGGLCDRHIAGSGHAGCRERHD